MSRRDVRIRPGTGDARALPVRPPNWWTRVITREDRHGPARPTDRRAAMSTLIETFQDLVAQVPDLVQPFIIAGAGAVPFIEGEGAVTIGILGGINPIIAA